MSCFTDICGDWNDDPATPKGQCTPRRLKSDCGISAVYANEPQTVSIPCPEGTVGETVSYTVAAGTVSSPFSVAAANATALAQAQAAAEALRAASPCVYESTEQECTETCPEGTIGDPITVVIPAGAFTSTVSQEVADAAALAEACAKVAYLREASPCYYENTEQSCEDVCPEGTTGETITITVPAGTYTSTVSQEAADAEALAAACAQVAALRAATPCETPDGFALWGWGSESDGQIGDGTTGGYQSVQFRMIDEEWLDVSGGYRHTLAVRSDGTLWACGARITGELGYGSFSDDSDVPYLVQIGTDTDWVQVLAGGRSSFGIKTDGSLWAWGECNTGQLGIPGLVGVDDLTFTPTQVGTDTDWAAVASAASGGIMTTFGLKTNGTIWVTGSNSARKQGRGTNGIFEWPDIEEFVQMGTDSDWAQIHRSWGNSMIALKTNGALYGWGANGSYQLGGVAGSEVGTPTQIGSDTDWVWTSLGAATIAIKADGRMFSCGSGAFGCLGNGSTSDQTTLTQVGSDSDWSKAWCGSDFVIAQKTDGSLYGWGANDLGQLGQGATSGLVLSPVQIGADTEWSIASSGRQHAIALRTTSTSPTPPAGFTTGAYGGTYAEAGGYSIHTFYGTSDLVVFENLTVDYLIVGGGGAGGGVGGGGGGRVREFTGVSLAPGTYTAGVGMGGARTINPSEQGGDGQSSSFNGSTAEGGGGGGAYETAGSVANGRPGSSGGGGGSTLSTAGTGGVGAVGQGFDGGDGVITGSAQGLSGGGGGGSGGLGADGSGTDEASGTGGNGGLGTASSITGSVRYYGAGGGGGGWTTGGSGGSSVGGKGATDAGPSAANLRVGQPNTGSGGGGGFGGFADPAPIAGDGANGVVIIRYLTPP